MKRSAQMILLANRRRTIWNRNVQVPDIDLDLVLDPLKTSDPENEQPPALFPRGTRIARGRPSR